MSKTTAFFALAISTMIGIALWLNDIDKALENAPDEFTAAIDSVSLNEYYCANEFIDSIDDESKKVEINRSDVVDTVNDILPLCSMQYLKNIQKSTFDAGKLAYLKGVAGVLDTAISLVKANEETESECQRALRVVEAMCPDNYSKAIHVGK